MPDKHIKPSQKATTQRVRCGSVVAHDKLVKLRLTPSKVLDRASYPWMVNVCFGARRKSECNMMLIKLVKTRRTHN
ncbi:MAG: hypothetical protein KBE07_09145, partial [Rhodoferax sp.]|nr:hypothetical protein [Rhodoferax sp.]